MRKMNAVKLFWVENEGKIEKVFSLELKMKLMNLFFNDNDKIIKLFMFYKMTEMNQFSILMKFHMMMLMLMLVDWEILSHIIWNMKIETLSRWLNRMLGVTTLLIWILVINYFNQLFKCECCEFDSIYSRFCYVYQCSCLMSVNLISSLKTTNKYTILIMF